MSKGKETTKLKLNVYDDLFGTIGVELGRTDMEEIPMEQLCEFQNHPFRVCDNAAMYELADSIAKQGVIYPALVRRDGADRFELIAGHRRKRASELAGKKTLPCIIMDITYAEAVKIMISTNIQRPEIVISEKAFAFRMEMEYTKENKTNVGRTDSFLAEQAGLGRSTIQRYIRLTYLNPELLTMVDEGKIGVTVGETLSYLKSSEQDDLYQFLAANQKYSVNGEQANTLKEYSAAARWYPEIFMNLFAVKGNLPAKVTINAKTLRKYFPETYSQEGMEQVIFSLLEKWSKGESK